MKGSRCLLLLLLLPALLAAEPRGPKPLALTHVAVIDATGVPARPDMTVVVSGDRIAAVGRTGKVKLPPEAEMVDAAGKFLIPGLWDMHVHGTAEFRDWIHALYLANGVTGVRHMGGESLEEGRQVQEVRREIEAGKRLGPRILTCLTMVDGPRPVWPGSIVASTEAEGRRAVETLQERGADFVKVYSLLPREAYFAITDEARKRRIPIAGHVPIAVTVAEASDAGQRSIEHMTNFRPEDVENRALFRRLAKNRTWQCPTLVVANAFAGIGEDTAERDPRLRYISPGMKAAWDLIRKGFQADVERTKRQYPDVFLGLVRGMHRAGVPMLAGTDVMIPSVYPGFSLHEELELLVQAGMTPMEALQTATRNPARFLGREKELGTVRKGRLADLVLLDADPLADIRNTRRIHAVIVNGRFLDRAALDRMLADAEAAAKEARL